MLTSAVDSALQSVPNSSQVATFVTNQIRTDEFVLDALANELQSTAGQGGTDYSSLDALLANDVIQLTKLDAWYEIQSLDNGSGA